jgi:hypothetical protein
VIVQGGPGETQPGGVDQGVSHLFGEPTREVMPGEKVLPLKELDPVMLFVMSDILTIQGDPQGTRGFHEPELSTGNELPPETATGSEPERISITRRTTVDHPMNFVEKDDMPLSQPFSIIRLPSPTLRWPVYRVLQENTTY